MNPQKYIAGAFLILPFQVISQHRIQHINMFWAGYYHSTKLNEKWALSGDAQIRTSQWTNKWSQFLFRYGANYSLKNRVTLTVGFAYFKSAEYTTSALLWKSEFRPWQEIAWKNNFHKINFTQRLRTEERFMQTVADEKLSGNYQFMWRTRYKFEVQIPLGKTKFDAIAGNEIMVNPGYMNSSIFFDQNRSSAGFNFHANQKSNFQLQYVKIYQWHSKASTMDNQDVLRINFVQQVNAFKKRKT